jgi:hypothetical protein
MGTNECCIVGELLLMRYFTLTHTIFNCSLWASEQVLQFYVSISFFSTMHVCLNKDYYAKQSIIQVICKLHSITNTLEKCGIPYYDTGTYL